MMKTKKINIGLGISGGLLLCSCATNIASLPITPRDQEQANNPYLAAYNEHLNSKEKITIAVVPNIPAKDPAMKQVQDSLGKRLDTMFSNLSDFKVVPRSEMGAIIGEVNLQNINAEEEKTIAAKNVEYLLVYSIEESKIGQSQSDKYDVTTGKSTPVTYFGGYISGTVTLLNLKTQEKEFTESITGQSGKSETKSIDLVEIAIQSAVKSFATQYAIKYAPHFLVIQTKGSGKVAMINAGKNYGLMVNNKIEFFNLKEVNGKKSKIPFAYGKIIEVGDDTAWAKVDDFETANVKENCFAAVRTDQSKSFLEIDN